MNSNTLPVHPSKRHPRTGKPLRAIFVRKDGRVFWPILGASPDDDKGGDGGGGGDDKGGAGGDDKGGDGGKGGADDKDKGGKGGADDKGGDLGFPKDTPVVEMTIEQQLAYHKHQSRKHEERATEYRNAAGGKTAADVKKDLENAAALAREKLTDQEKALEDAKEAVRAEVKGEYGPMAVKTALKLLLPDDMPEAEQEAEIELLDLSKFITESGDVDTAKVRRAAEKISPTPAGKDGEQRLRKWGQGDRRNDKSSGVAAGKSLYEERHGSKSKSTTTSS